jgi:hypothetical protein
MVPLLFRVPRVAPDAREKSAFSLWCRALFVDQVTLALAFADTLATSTGSETAARLAFDADLTPGCFCTAAAG